MKKLIIAAMLISAFASCEKEKAGECYRCEFFDVNNTGHARAPEMICTDKLPDAFYDSEGAEMAFVCTKK